METSSPINSYRAGRLAYSTDSGAGKRRLFAIGNFGLQRLLSPFLLPIAHWTRARKFLPVLSLLELLDCQGEVSKSTSVIPSDQIHQQTVILGTFGIEKSILRYEIGRAKSTCLPSLLLSQPIHAWPSREDQVQALQRSSTWWVEFISSLIPDIGPRIPQDFMFYSYRPWLRRTPRSYDLREKHMKG